MAINWEDYYKPSDIVSNKLKENKQHKEKIGKKIHSFVIPIPGTKIENSTATNPLDESDSISESPYNSSDTGIIGQQNTYFGLERTTLNAAGHPVTISSTVTKGFDDINNFLYTSSVLDNGRVSESYIQTDSISGDLNDIIPGTVKIDMNKSMTVQMDDGTYKTINPRENK